MEAVFATLTPANLSAKLAFSALATHFAAQNGSTNKRFVRVNTQQQYDRDVLRYHMALRRPLRADDAFSESSTEIDTDVEDIKPSGMIWTGCYTFNIDPDNVPGDCSKGWTAGKGAPETVVDFLLTTNGRQPDIRSQHAMFNFHRSTGYLYLVSRASSNGRSPVTVNGHDIARGMTYSLNQKAMKIRLGTLEYVFDYTDFSNSAEFREDRVRYMTQYLGISESNFDLTPTPSGQPRTIGDWTFSNPLGAGSFGRVHSATDSKGRIAAIKTVERRSRNANHVKNEVRILKELTTLAESEGAQDQILRLIDVIYPKTEEYTNDPFEEITLVLQPCVRETFDTLITARKTNNRYAFSIQVMSAYIIRTPISQEDLIIFHSALQGVRFLHSHGWIHRDLKPQNIGYTGSQAVLLDVDGAIKLDPGTLAPATPGNGGTVPYLAPEREMQDYDDRVDVWSMGLILSELLYSSHPWMSFKNPWRAGHEHLRNKFHELYEQHMKKIRSDPRAKPG